MYRHIHDAYLETGVDLLRRLSLAGPEDLRIARQQALDSYNQELSRELRNYIERVRKYPPPIPDVQNPLMKHAETTTHRRGTP